MRPAHHTPEKSPRPARPTTTTISVVAVLAAIQTTLPAHASDFIVDASGGPGALTTIAAAMAVAAPGDRILVLPGTYPAFQFERGVEVMGLGSSPAEVTIARVDFHVSIPNQNYDAVLSNVTVCGNSPLDAISISGNELARGTFVIEGVQTCGGVYLAGEPDFQLVVQNTSIAPAPGGGFLGAAFDFGGGSAELVDVAIVGWNAIPGLAAAHGLRISEEATVRVTGGSIRGGDGTDIEAGGFADGADGVTSLPWPNPVTLELAGGTDIRGGDGAGAVGAGGAGVRALGTPTSLTVGVAAVAGGLGAPQGAPYGLDAATALGYDPSLVLAGGSTPGGASPGHRSVRWVAGDMLVVTSDPTIAATARLTLFTEVEPVLAPLGGLYGGFAPRRFAVPSLALVVPGNPPAPQPMPRLRLVFQAEFADPVTGHPRLSNPVVVRVDG